MNTSSNTSLRLSASEFLNDLDNRVLVLDGAMGTMIQAYNLSEADFRGYRFRDHKSRLAGCNDLLCLTRPDVISGIHDEYLSAGADIIETDTFNSNGISLAEYGISDLAPEINLKGAQLARAAADRHIEATGRKVYVAGSMGPTGVSLSIGGAIDFDTLANEYRKQALALIQGGVDLLLLETVFDTLNVKAAIYGIDAAFEEAGGSVPLIISATLTETGRLLSGQSVEAFIASVSHARPVCVGFNCSFGADAMAANVKALAAYTPFRIIVYPNAGLPDAMGNYSQTPQMMASQMQRMLDEGIINIMGGCCGTTPAHIAGLAAIARGKMPFQPHPDDDILRLSGLECVEIGRPGHFTKVGERCNVAGSRKFLRLIKEGNTSEAVEIAAGQAKKGASVIDINMDDGMLDAASEMTAFISNLSSDIDTARIPLMIDSSDFNVIRKALRILQGRSAVNSISLKNGEEEFISHALEIQRLGAVPVVMAFDEKGQATSFERRTEICARSYKILTERCGFLGKEIIFDPNILAIATGIAEHDSYALDFIKTVAWIKGNLPGAKISGGVSNLSFSFRGNDPVRKALHAVFLKYAIEAGMDMAIVNPTTPIDTDSIDSELCDAAENLILLKEENAAEKMLDLAMRIKAESAPAKKAPAATPDSPKISASEQLLQLVAAGARDIPDQLISQALADNGSAFKVVREVLMEGMNRVGDLFAKGEIFLPQVVRSASAMKKAIDFLTPTLEAEASSGQGHSDGELPVFILATVKGDVHDIGKNIVAIVLRCSGFKVIDLGVMVPASDIVEAAIANNAAFVGLSGLITPSLHEMTEVARCMQQAGLSIPLFIGGATTSDLHTAVKIDPCYEGPVVHTGDAAALPPVASALADPTTSAATKKEIELRLDSLRKNYTEKNSLLPLDKARELADKVESPAPAPSITGRVDFNFSVDEVLPYLNLKPLLNEWGFSPNLENPQPEARKLLDDVNSAIEQLRKDGMTVKGRLVVMRATVDGDDIMVEIPSDENGNAASSKTLRLCMLRSQVPNPITGRTRCMSDFINGEDTLAMFAVTTAGSIIDNIEDSADYDTLLLKSVAHRLVEAATHRLHLEAKRNIWHVDDDCGIRPAVGYPCMPDQSLIFDFDKVIDYASMDIFLTENGAMKPTSTTSGLIIANKDSKYFEVGKIGSDQILDYVNRRGVDKDTIMPFLSKNL